MSNQTTQPDSPPGKALALVVATPIEAEPVGQARAIAVHRPAMPVAEATPIRPKTDVCAIASAICGVTAIVPVLSQVAGLGLGIAALIRIRRVRRAGGVVGGTAWAIGGMACSVFALVSWVAVFGLLTYLSTTLAGSSEALSSVSDLMQLAE